MKHTSEPGNKSSEFHSELFASSVPFPLNEKKKKKKAILKYQ